MSKAREFQLVVPGLKIKNGAIAGRYRVEKLLGTGSIGFVLAAHHIYLRRPVVMKILASARPSVQKRALATAHVVASLQSQHIARMIDTGFTEEGIPFIATEALEGRTLAEELAVRGSLPAMEAVRFVLQACDALGEAHDAGVVHGSLKTSNLFVAGPIGGSGAVGAPAIGGDGFGRSLKILDFGMPAPFGDDENETEEGAQHGRATWFASPAYLAPEQLRDPNPNHLTPQVDVWALGVILHQLIAGTFPFAADTVAGMLVAVAYDEPSLLARPDVPYELARVIHQCLAKHPGQRIADVKTLAQMLAPFSGTKVLEPGKTTAPMPVVMTQPPVASVESSMHPPPMTMTIDQEVPHFPAPSTSKTPAEKASRDVPTAPSLARIRESGAFAKLTKRIEGALRNERAEDLAPDVAAFHRRRKGAIAMVAVAAALGLVGLVAPPAMSAVASVRSKSPQPDVVGKTTTTSADLADVATSDPVTAEPDARETALAFEPRPFVPHSFMLVEAFIAAPPTPTPTPVPTNPQNPPPSVRTLDVVTTPTPKSSTKEAINKARSRLFVRDDPYSPYSKNVWTHPRHLNERPPVPRR